MTQVLWEFVDATHASLFWKPLPALEQVSLDEVERLLHKDHGIIVREQVDPDLFVLLPGQLLRIRSLSYDDYPLIHPFAAERDVAQVHAVPVALAFPLPEKVRTRLDTTQETAPLTAAHFFPPATFGQIGVVFAEGQRWSYPLHVLDAQASQLQAELATMLQQLSEQDFLRSSALYQHAQVLAFRLACWYRDYHQTTHPLPPAESASGGGVGLPVPSVGALPLAVFSAGSSPVGRLSVPPLFQPGHLALIPSPLPTRAVLAATSAAQHRLAKWSESEEGIPTFLYREAAGTTMVEVRPKDLAQEIDEQLKAALWEIVKRLSPLEGAIFLALLGFCLAASPDETGNHWIPVERILEARGILPKMKDGWRAGYRWEDMVRVAEGIDRLNTFWLQIEQVLHHVLLQPGAAPAQEQWSHYSKLLHIEGVIMKRRVAGVMTSTHYLAEDVSLSSGRGLPVAWHLHFGTWLRPYLQGPNRQVVRMDQRCLTYHVSDEQWELLLLQYITFLRTRNRGQNPLHLLIGTLFDELSLPINTRHPQKTMDRFHAAWSRLIADNQVAQVKPNYDASQFHSHKWLNHWFNCSLTVVLPPSKG